MKKFCLSVILALAMTMSLTGCSQTPKQEPAKTGACRDRSASS